MAWDCLARRLHLGWGEKTLPLRKHLFYGLSLFPHTHCKAWWVGWFRLSSFAYQAAWFTEACRVLLVRRLSWWSSQNPPLLHTKHIGDLVVSERWPLDPKPNVEFCMTWSAPGGLWIITFFHLRQGFFWFVFYLFFGIVEFGVTHDSWSPELVIIVPRPSEDIHRTENPLHTRLDTPTSILL